MKKQNIIILLAVVIALVTLFYSFRDSQDQSTYIKQIQDERAEKDRFMRNSSESPFVLDTTLTYTGLKYYSPDVRYKITAMGPMKGKLFLAFGDETSGAETYGAGRYLDITKTPGSNTIILDFNQAYNPYCAYSNSFSCPLPPPENLLRVAIRAGEKTYHQ